MSNESDRKLVQNARRHYERLKVESESWRPFWRDVKTYICPGRGRFLASNSSNEVNRGEVNDLARINCEVSRAMDVLASGIQSGLTSKARQWFQLVNPNPGISQEHEARVWYGQVQEILEGIFRKSNVYSALRNVYYEMASFGQGVMSVEWHPENVINCRCHTCGTYLLEANSRQEIDTVFYIDFLTAQQLVEKYGSEVVGDEIAEIAKKSGAYSERYETINLVTKDPQRYGLEFKESSPVASVHFLARAGRDDGFLRKSSYRMFPFMCPRWDTVDNDVYGWGPSRDIMGDVKMLQKMEADKLKGLAKIVTPPMRIPPEMERRGLNMRPGGLNVVSSLGDQAVAPLYTVGIDIQQLQMAAEQIKQGIKDGLYNSLFLSLLMQDNPQMTATEVQARQSEKLLMLGPVLERIHYELLDPLINRTFWLAWDEGLIPEPPESVLEGEETQIEYVSILSQAQKAVGVARIEQSMSFLGSMLQTAPEMRHLVDWYKMYKTYNSMIGVREDIFKKEEDYLQAVNQEKQMAQMAQMAQVAQPMAESAKALTEVNPADIQSLLGGGIDMGGVL